MRQLFFPAFLVVLSTSAFAQYHNPIKPIEDVNSSARQIIKNFELTDRKLVTGAPEYKYAYESFLKQIKGKEAQLSKDLAIIADKLSYDYSILKSLEGKTKTSALKETIKQAEKRLEEKVKAEKYTYHAALNTFITPPNGLMQQCLSALCVNQVLEDYKEWINEAKDLNKTIKVYDYKLKKMSFKKRRFINNYKDQAESISGRLPIAIEKTDEKFLLIAKYGAENFFKFNYEEIKKYGMDMLIKHGSENLQYYPVADLEKYGAENIRKHSISSLNKFGAEALNKFNYWELEKYGYDLLNKYGLENCEKFKAELLNQYGAEALNKYSVELLSESSVEELNALEAKHGLQAVKAYGPSLKRFSLEDLKKYSAKRLETYGETKLNTYAQKYGLDYVLSYSLESLDKFGAEALDSYGERALKDYGLANCQKFGVSELDKWGADAITKYGIKNLVVIGKPQSLVGHNTYTASWNNDYYNNESHSLTCASVLGVKAKAVVTHKWKVMDNYPITKGSYYSVPHISGKMVLQECTAQSCRGWETIYCAKE